MMPSQKCSKALTLAAMAGLLVSWDADAQTTIPPRTTIIASIDHGNGSDIVLVNSGRARKIYSDPNYALIWPVLSPDGKNIAFDRVVPMAQASEDIVVIDLNGKVLSSNFIDKNPLVRHKKSYHEPFDHLSEIAWAGDQLVILANPVFETGVGLKFKPSPNTSLNDGPDLLDDADAIGFDSVGPMGISPTGRHIATVTGLEAKYEYTSCAGFGAKDANDEPAFEQVEIDGSKLPAFKMPIVAVSSFVWYNDQKVSVIVRDPEGFQILTISNIPNSFHWAPSNGHSAADLNGDNDQLLNPPASELKRIPINTDDITKVVLDGYLDAGKRYNIIAYPWHSDRPVSGWTVSGDSVVQADLTHLNQNPADVHKSRKLKEDILENVGPIVAPLAVAASAHPDVSCRSSSQCGPLAQQPYENGTRNFHMIHLPPVCLPAVR